MALELDALVRAGFDGLGVREPVERVSWIMPHQPAVVAYLEMGTVFAREQAGLIYLGGPGD
jgi:hypothetical protein